MWMGMVDRADERIIVRIIMLSIWQIRCCMATRGFRSDGRSAKNEGVGGSRAFVVAKVRFEFCNKYLDSPVR